MEEDGIRFSVSKGVFYNPAMRFCRSFSSLAVGAIGQPLEVVDAFSASGIRGIRYAKENRNVRKLTFIDIEKSAIALAKKNAKANRLKATAALGNISRLAFDYDADFLEIDPFGTPSPYLVDAFRFFNTKKAAYLSVTATDVAVLCGGKVAPCMKNYHSKPLNNEFTHETGLRIMLKKIVETAAEFNMGIEPLVSLSDRHYLKTVVAARRGADSAFGCMKALGYVYACPKCGLRGAGKFPLPRCTDCGADNDYAGPLWLGELHNLGFVNKMSEINDKRKYADKGEISNALAMMRDEIGMPPFYYNVHELCGMGRLLSVPTMDAVIERLSASGFRACRTHFSPVSIKTGAPYHAVREAVGWKN